MKIASFLALALAANAASASANAGDSSALESYLAKRTEIQLRTIEEDRSRDSENSSDPNYAALNAIFRSALTKLAADGTPMFPQLGTEALGSSAIFVTSIFAILMEPGYRFSAASIAYTSGSKYACRLELQIGNFYGPTPLITPDARGTVSISRAACVGWRVNSEEEFDLRGKYFRVP